MSLAEKLAAERRGRLAAERLLELKQAELFAANRKLGLHARALSEEVLETRAEVASVRDENRRVKSDLSVAHQKVEIAERRLWHSIQTIQDGFAFFDTDDRLIAANDSYMVVFDGLEDVKPGVAYAKLLQLLTEEGIVDTGEQTAAEWRADMLRRRQLAEPEPVVIRLWNDQYVKMVDHRGPSGDLVSLGLNITSTVRYERDLHEARERAESAARAKSAFLANMSHEIRTPMNGVVGMAELLLDTTLDEEQKLYADTIRNSGEALLVIINDVLDYSKIDAQKMVLHTAPCDLEKSIHEVLMLLQPAAREKDVALLLDYDMFLPHHFEADVGRIRQILTNLIGNAVKFTATGHVLVRVIGAPEKNGDRMMVHIVIEDTGIGISEENLDQIFGEFTQVEDERNRKFEGTGLGLAISKRLVELMEGEIWADSEVGVGSCFGFRVPLEVCADAPPLPLSIPERLRKVMIVDDNRTNREILCRQLELLKVQADAFASAMDALQDLEGGYDLMIVDHQMPEIDGPELIRRVRAGGNDIPIVMLSSNPGGIADAEVKSQISAVLTRPLPRDRLIKALRELGARIPPKDDEEPGSDANAAAQDEPAVATAARASEPDETGAGSEPVENGGDVQSGEAEGTKPAPAASPMFRARRRDPDAATQPPAANPAPVPAPATDNTAMPAAELPVASIVASSSAADVPASDPAGPEAPCAGPRRMRILAAEDNKTNQLVFRKMVKDLDIDLLIANNGREAVEKYQSFEPDMIFMDISMPEMDGKQATGAIRQLEAGTGGHVPVVALTAHAMDGDDQGILAAGLDHYLTKPLRKPAIHEMIRNLVPNEVADPFPNQAA